MDRFYRIRALPAAQLGNGLILRMDRQPHDKLKRPSRVTKPDRTNLFVWLAVVALLAGVLYSQRYLVQSLLTGTHFVAGLAFYTTGQFPQRYHGLFVAFHGSMTGLATRGGE